MTELQFKTQLRDFSSLLHANTWLWFVYSHKPPPSVFITDSKTQAHHLTWGAWVDQSVRLQNYTIIYFHLRGHYNFFQLEELLSQCSPIINALLHKNPHKRRAWSNGMYSCFHVFKLFMLYVVCVSLLDSSSLWYLSIIKLIIFRLNHLLYDSCAEI